MDLDLAGISNEDLLTRANSLRRGEMENLVDLLTCLSEIDRRELPEQMGYPDLFKFCVGRLRYSEGAAARRVNAVRACDRFPALYSYLRDGSLSLSAVGRLRPHLTSANFDDVVKRACGRSQLELERLIAELANLATRADASETVAPAELEFSFKAAVDAPEHEAESAETTAIHASGGRKPDTIRFEGNGRVRISFVANDGLRVRLEKAKRLMRGSGPTARLEDIISRLLEHYLSRHDPFERQAPRLPPRERETRRIPKWVRDLVWKRDQARCSYRAPNDTLCGSTERLQFDHIRPWSMGGSSDDPKNVRLLCRAHNMHYARMMFGERVPRRVIHRKIT